MKKINYISTALFLLATITNSQVVITPNEYLHALRNPLKGLRWGFKNQEWSAEFPNVKHPFISCGKWYIGWEYLEDDEADGVEKISNYCDGLWANLPSGNNKIIPRVYLSWPDNETHWPMDMTDGDYTSEQFKLRLKRLIQRLGKVWDTDPRIGYIEMGIIGDWGEQHTPKPDAQMQKLLGDEFQNAFKNKRVMTAGNINQFTDYTFGIYWDSHSHQVEEFIAEGIDAHGDRWKDAVYGGEVAYNWGGVTDYVGDDPTENMTTPKYYNRVINYIRRCHTNHLGWIAEYDVDNPQTSTGADLVQKALGYRFVIEEVRYPAKVIPGENFDISFAVKNTGSSPFYYKWPVEVSLLDTGDNSVVWKEVFQKVDIRSWQPGNGWKYDHSDPSIPGIGYDTVSIYGNEMGTFNIPDTIANGKYILALSIVDPSGMLPSIKFAIENYFVGGRHPIGYIGINENVADAKLTGVSFDDLQSDRSLHYVYPTPKNITVTSPSGKDIWKAGIKKIVTWDSYGGVGRVDVDLSTDGGFTWTSLITNTDNDGNEAVNVPDIKNVVCRIRVKETGSSTADISNANFAIDCGTGIGVSKGSKNIDPVPVTINTTCAHVDIRSNLSGQIKITRIDGSTVFIRNITKAGNCRIGFDNLPSGVYCITVLAGSWQMTSRFVVQH